MSLPYRITTKDRKRLRTAHGLTSCRRAFAIDAYDIKGNQHIVYTGSIRSHSAGSLPRPKAEPKQPAPCGYCGYIGEAVETGGWPECGNCGGI